MMQYYDILYHNFSLSVLFKEICSFHELQHSQNTHIKKIFKINMK